MKHLRNTGKGSRYLLFDFGHSFPRCAVTGWKLINGGGRAEAEAAHIRPVEHGGPDSVRNGLALSGTAHWMFDRGLIGLSDDLDILISRPSTSSGLNDRPSVEAIVNRTGKALVHSVC